MPDTVLYSLIVGLIVVLAGSLVSREHKRREIFTQKADALRATLMPTLTRLQQRDETATSAIIEQSLEQQQIAVDEFRLHLSKWWWARPRFNKAWMAYRGRTQNDRTDDYYDYRQHERQEPCRQLAIKRIHGVLRFAGMKE